MASCGAVAVLGRPCGRLDDIVVVLFFCIMMWCFGSFCGVVLWQFRGDRGVSGGEASAALVRTQLDHQRHHSTQ